MGAFNVNKLYRLFTGQVSEEELVQVMESEDRVPDAPAPDVAKAPGAAA